jgi:hypothetical protein
MSTTSSLQSVGWALSQYFDERAEIGLRVPHWRIGFDPYSALLALECRIEWAH